MEVVQVAELTNEITKEIVGEEAVVNEDLSNVVEVGSKIINGDKAIENYTKKLVDRIGKVVFVDREYAGFAPSVMMDSWEYGSIKEKITAEMPEADVNEDWQLENGKVYEQDKFYQPQVSAQFFNKAVTLEVDQSFAERQVKSAFTSGVALNAFYSMLQNEVKKSLTVATDGLIQRTINNMIAQTLKSGGARVVDLLTMYNLVYAGEISAPLTEAKAIHDPNFIRYASYVIGLYPKRLSAMSSLFNIGGTRKFTSPARLKTVFLDEFYSASSVFLQSDTFHDENVKFPAAETVPFWQGSGTGFAFSDTSMIDVKVASPNSTLNGAEVKSTGILGIMFDREALGVSCIDRSVKTHVNAKADFYTNFHKFKAEYFNDANENCIVFTIGKVVEPTPPDTTTPGA